MKNFFTRNLGWKALSLLIAFVLWVAVAREPEVATSLTAPVEFKNMRDSLDIDGSLPDRVRLEVRGPSGRMTRDNLSAVAVVLDLADAQAGERTYSIRGRNLNLPTGVVFYRAVPSQLTLRFNQLIYKRVPVQPIFVNKAAGTRIVTQQISVSEIELRGSEDRVQPIRQVKTDPMDLNGILGDKVLHTHLNVGDPQVRLVNAPTDVVVQLKIEKTANGGAR